MKFSSLFILSILERAYASDISGTEILGDSFDSRDNTDAELRDLIRNAQQNPKASREVSFKPFDALQRVGSYSQATQPSADVEWTWPNKPQCVNVSEYPAPASSEYENIADPHIVTTTYDFSWPRNGNLSDELLEPRGGLCLTWLSSTLDIPANVTDQYTEDNTNDPSCVPVLGQACVDAILSEGRTSASSAQGRCESGEFWPNLPACQSTLGYAQGRNQFTATNTVSLGFLNSTTNATNVVENRRGWYGRFTGPQSGGESEAYYNATTRLHVAMVNPVIPTDPGSNLATVYSQGAELLCMRVNATKVGTEENVGSSLKQSTVWTLSAASLVSFAFMLMG